MASPPNVTSFARELRSLLDAERDALHGLADIRAKIRAVVAAARGERVPWRALARGVVDATGEPATSEKTWSAVVKRLRERDRRARRGTLRGADLS